MFFSSNFNLVGSKKNRNFEYKTIKIGMGKIKKRNFFASISKKSHKEYG